MVKIKNWSKYQSYKDRKPPWIRFHRSMLDEYKFQMMSADARAMLPMFWLLACEHEDPKSGLVTLSLQEISFRLRQSEHLVTKVMLELQANDFIECNESVTKAYQESSENVTTETETETETENTSAEKPKKPIFNFDTGEFENLDEVIIQKWQEAYPAVDVYQEIKQATAWLMSNPKNRKSDYRRFLNNWLSRAQDRAPRSNFNEASRQTGRLSAAEQAVADADYLRNKLREDLEGEFTVEQSDN